MAGLCEEQGRLIIKIMMKKNHIRIILRANAKVWCSHKFYDRGHRTYVSPHPITFILSSVWLCALGLAKANCSRSA
jgi:hypothetical protein